MKYGDDFVDEQYSDILEPNLYTDNVMIPDVTYNAQYEGDVHSGLVHIYKEKRLVNGNVK